MVTQRKPRASKYLTTPTRPVQVDRDRSVAGLLEKMEGTALAGDNSRKLIVSGWTCWVTTRRLWWPVRGADPCRDAATAGLRDQESLR